MRHFGQPHHIHISIGFPVVVVLTNVRHVSHPAVSVYIIAQFETFSSLPLLTEKAGMD